MSKTGLCLTLVMMLLAGGLTAQPSGDEGAASSQAVASTPAEEMKVLAGKGLTEAIQMMEKTGTFYPFSIIYRGDRLQVGTYTGEMADRPPADQYALGMLVKLREVVRKHQDVTAIVLAKPYSAELQDGTRVNGAWVLVDHREAEPWVVFQPLIPSGEPGRFSLGEQVIQATDDWIFESAQ